MSLVALCDCNNFFVSCERLYHPELRNKPIVVLSGNDGCIISRSNDVKAMGVPMGAAYHSVADFLRHREVVVFSGNHRLYADISRRVMDVLSRHTDRMEVYSIDEAFLNLEIKSIADPVAYCAQMRSAVARYVGVPISVGIAPTKTLSKLAAERAKGMADGVCRLRAELAGPLLDELPIGDVWGIGRRSARMLESFNIRTAGDLLRRDPVWVKRHLTVRGLITQLELKGQPCVSIREKELLPKSILVSASFGRALSDPEQIERAIIEHTLKAAVRLRKNGLAAGSVTVHLLQGYVTREHKFISDSVPLDNPACSDMELTKAALTSLRELYGRNHQQDDFYTKSGVTLTGLTAPHRQLGLFDEEARARGRHDRLSFVIDRINAECGHRAVYPVALAARDKLWKPQSKNRSNAEMEVCLAMGR